MHMYKADLEWSNANTHRHTHTLYLPIYILIMRYPSITSSGGIQGPSVSAHKNTHTLFLTLSLSLVYPVISVNKRQTLFCSDRAGGGGGGLSFIVLRARRCSRLMNGAFWSWEPWSFTHSHLQAYFSHSYYETHTHTAFLSLVIPSPCSSPFSLRFHPLFSVFFPAHWDGRPRSVSKLLSRPIPLHTNACQNWFAVFLLCLSTVFPH